jgi:hypothetical protein
MTFLPSQGSSTTKLRDRRYEAVIHLVTAANGAEKFYSLTQAEDPTTGAATARHESIEEAIQIDEKTRRAWEGHRHLYVVDNYLVAIKGDDANNAGGNNAGANNNAGGANNVDANNVGGANNTGNAGVGKIDTRKKCTFNEKMHRVIDRILAVTI